MKFFQNRREKRLKEFMDENKLLTKNEEVNNPFIRHLTSDWMPGSILKVSGPKHKQEYVIHWKGINLILSEATPNRWMIFISSPLKIELRNKKSKYFRFLEQTDANLNMIIVDISFVFKMDLRFLLF